MEADRYRGTISVETDGIKLAMGLLKGQDNDGSVPGARASITCSDGDGLRVETTALAVLSWLRARDALRAIAGEGQGSGK